ncbi:MAG TPA: heavy-metal-associated domain-containing protein [Arthrobacter sp.]|nr:heavy-metal-associated domain-containing protein [Arthrobacter sp.]
MRTVKFEIEPLTNPACVQKIEDVVGNSKGVASVQVLLNSNKVKVTFDEEVVVAESLALSITDLGHPVISTKSALPTNAV